MLGNWLAVAGAVLYVGFLVACVVGVVYYATHQPRNDGGSKAE